MNVEVGQDEDEDVLLVGDYDPDPEEQSEFLGVLSPSAGRAEVAEPREVNRGVAAIRRHRLINESEGVPDAKIRKRSP